MPLGEMGAFLLFLAVIFVFGNLWFHFVETILRWIKKLFIGQILRRGIDSPYIRMRMIETNEIRTLMGQ